MNNKKNVWFGLLHYIMPRDLKHNLSIILTKFMAIEIPVLALSVLYKYATIEAASESTETFSADIFLLGRTKFVQTDWQRIYYVTNGANCYLLDSG